MPGVGATLGQHPGLFSPRHSPLCPPVLAILWFLNLLWLSRPAPHTFPASSDSLLHFIWPLNPACPLQLGRLLLCLWIPAWVPKTPQHPQPALPTTSVLLQPTPWHGTKACGSLSCQHVAELHRHDTDARKAHGSSQSPGTAKIKMVASSQALVGPLGVRPLPPYL